MPPPITLRDAGPADREFLLRVYASSRADELAQVPWGEEQKRTFVAMQFEAQDVHYRQEFADAAFSVIVRGDQPIGRMYIARQPTEITLIEISLLPEFRNAGIGTALVEDLLEEARAAALPVRLHVELFNPARRWYERLGFEPLEEQGVHLWMEWRPAARR